VQVAAAAIEVEQLMHDQLLTIPNPAVMFLDGHENHLLRLGTRAAREGAAPAPRIAVLGHELELQGAAASAFMAGSMVSSF
jgi:hypothetical protein